MLHGTLKVNRQEHLWRPRASRPNLDAPFVRRPAAVCGRGLPWPPSAALLVHPVSVEVDEHVSAPHSLYTASKTNFADNRLW